MVICLQLNTEWTVLCLITVSPFWFLESKPIELVEGHFPWCKQVWSGAVECTVTVYSPYPVTGPTVAPPQSINSLVLLVATLALMPHLTSLASLDPFTQHHQWKLSHKIVTHINIMEEVTTDKTILFVSVDWGAHLSACNSDSDWETGRSVLETGESSVGTGATG